MSDKNINPVQRLLNRLQYSQRRLSRESGVSQAYISQIINEGFVPGGSVMPKLKKFAAKHDLDIDANWFYRQII